MDAAGQLQSEDLDDYGFDPAAKEVVMEAIGALG